MALTPAHPGVVHVDGKDYLLNPEFFSPEKAQEIRATASPPKRWLYVIPIVALLLAAFLGTSQWPIGVAMRSWMPEDQDAGWYWLVALFISVFLASCIAPRGISKYPAKDFAYPRATQVKWITKAGIVADGSSGWKPLWQLTCHLDVLGESYERVASAREGIEWDGAIPTLADAEATLRADLAERDRLIRAAGVRFDEQQFATSRGLPLA